MNHEIAFNCPVCGSDHTHTVSDHGPECFKCGNRTIYFDENLDPTLEPLGHRAGATLAIPVLESRHLVFKCPVCQGFHWKHVRWGQSFFCGDEKVYFDKDLNPTLSANKAIPLLTIHQMETQLLTLTGVFVLLVALIAVLFYFGLKDIQKDVSHKNTTRYILWTSPTTLPTGVPFLHRSHRKDSPHWNKDSMVIPLKLKQESGKLYYHAIEDTTGNPNSAYWKWEELVPDKIPTEPDH